MALDLARYLDGRPVLARPTQYASTLETRVRPHVAHIDEWLRLKLIHPHEADRLRAAYRPARRARGRLDRGQPRAVVLADRAVSRRVPAVRRQPLLFRRAPLLPRRRGRDPAVPGPGRAVPRPERRGAAPVPHRAEGRRRRLLPGGREPPAAVPAHLVSRSRRLRRTSRNRRPVVRRRVGVESPVAGDDLHCVRLVRLAGPSDEDDRAQRRLHRARRPADAGRAGGPGAAVVDRR